MINIPIEVGKTQYNSAMAGFRKTFIREYAVAIASQSLAAGEARDIRTTIGLVNPDDISRVSVKWDGIETFWRTVDGYVVAEKPSWAAATYEIGSFAYFSGTTHTVFTYLANETGGVVNTPAFTMRVRLELYDTPFA